MPLDRFAPASIAASIPADVVHRSDRHVDLVLGGVADDRHPLSS
jgi:uncharacterized protein (DUF2345 family)